MYCVLEFELYYIQYLNFSDCKMHPDFRGKILGKSLTEVHADFGQHFPGKELVRVCDHQLMMYTVMSLDSLLGYVFNILPVLILTYSWS